jgi:hypothetical protein
VQVKELDAKARMLGELTTALQREFIDHQYDSSSV